MGANIVRNLLGKKWRIVGWNRTASVSQELKKSGMVVADTVEDLVKKLTDKPRVIWLMLPAGKVIDEMLGELLKYLRKGDVVIDAANGNYKDAVREKRNACKNKEFILWMWDSPVVHPVHCWAVVLWLVATKNFTKSIYDYFMT